jgi:hypothetical protein
MFCICSRRERSLERRWRLDIGLGQNYYVDLHFISDPFDCAEQPGPAIINCRKTPRRSTRATTMKSRMWVVGSFVILLAAPLLSREKSDVIILDNSDRLTGEIKSLKSGVLYVSLDYVDGTIAVQWSNLRLARDSPVPVRRLPIVRRQSEPTRRRRGLREQQSRSARCPLGKT